MQDYVSYRNQPACGHYYLISEFSLQLIPAIRYISDDYLKIKVYNLKININLYFTSVKLLAVSYFLWDTHFEYSQMRCGYLYLLGY